MADHDVKFRVRLDLGGAKADIEELMRTLDDVSKRQSRRLSDQMKGGWKAAALGAAAGFGLAQAHNIASSTQSGIGAIIGETTGYLGAWLEKAILGDMGIDAKAKQQTREEMIHNFGPIIAQQNAVPPSVRSWFTAMSKINEMEGKARQIVMDPSNKDFFGPGIGDMVAKIMDGIGGLLKSAVEQLAEKLNPFK